MKLEIWTVTGWLSKIFKDKKGYKRFADSGTPVHRYVAERKYGRKLKNREVVHHKKQNQDGQPKEQSLGIFLAEEASCSSPPRQEAVW